jgi:hypothetical protein
MKTDIHTPLPQVSTLSGELSLISPDPDAIRLTDIVVALRHENRYGGHTNEPVSVLQHSLTVWLISFMHGHGCADQRRALWHDAPEAYIKDLPRPLKKVLGEAYAEIERRFEVAIGIALSVDMRSPAPWLKHYDNRALAAECTLYRPTEAYGDWANLPAMHDGDRSAALVAKKIAGLPGGLTILLDNYLKDGALSGVQRFVASTFGSEWQHGAWQEVMA